MAVQGRLGDVVLVQGSHAMHPGKHSFLREKGTWILGDNIYHIDQSFTKL